jgi:hypothetical protein
VAVAAGVVLASAAWSIGAPLPPGTTLYPAPSGSLPGGTALAGGAPVPFASSTFTGSLTSTVLQNDPTNPLGGLTFTYVLQDLPASPGAIEGLFVDSFAGVMANADFVAGAGMVPPTYIDRSVSSGSDISASFAGPPLGSGPLEPGQASEFVIYTNSHVFMASLAIVTDGSAVQVASYATPALPGDVNFDGIVNGQDIALIASDWLHMGVGIAGDANYDGIVNGQDIAVIASHWLDTAGSSGGGGVAGGAGGGSAVPEPSTVVLAAVGGLALLACRQWRLA